MSATAETNAATSPAVRRRWKRARWTVRGACLVAAALLLWPAVPGARALAVLPALSPFTALGSLLASRAFPALAWLGCIVALAVMLRHRWFCRWMCPTGTCADVATGLGRRLGRRGARIGLPGHWLLWLTVGGAAVGYPLFLWLDPLALFAGPFRLARPGALADVSAWVGAGGLAALIAVSFVWPNLWCGRICPLGALQDVVPRLDRLPRSLRRAEKAEPSPSAQFTPRVARRAVIGGLLGAALASTVRWSRASTPRPLRPPGAIDESEFLGVCLRCGNCSRVCPPRIIETEMGERGVASLMTPVVSYRRDYCREDCVLCTEACPSGALARLSLEEKPAASIGRPRVDMSICLLGEARECSACRAHCPYEAVGYVWSEEDYTLTPRVDPKRCNGCGACEVACPTSPRKAIVVMLLGEDLRAGES